jgi:5-methylcytosine-specific restriction protein A
METDLSRKPFVIVDLYAGRWVMSKIGHECFNFDPNPVDGKYYGYCPPYGNMDITRLGAGKKDEYIDNVMVIYTQKVSGSANREIIGFTDSARIYRQGIIDPTLGRRIPEDGKEVDCSYCIISDNLYDLKEYPVKYIIRSAEYSSSLFRGQRVFKGKHPDLDKEVISYLKRYLKDMSDEDSLVFQRFIQEEDVYEGEASSDGWSKEPQFAVSGGSKAVSKNAHISKLALLHAGYKCAADASHSTFNTSKGVRYMEGHHLIPCTYSNAVRFWEERKRNIDCEENIVSICPTCHRRVHFGSREEKEAILRVLYDKQIEKLRSVNLGISFEELLSFY